MKHLLAIAILACSLPHSLSAQFGELDLLKITNKTPVVEFEYFITDKVEKLGEIVASWQPNNYLTNNDVVYIQTNQPVSPGDVFSIYQDHGSVGVPGQAFSSAGRRIQVLGGLKVTEIQEEVVEAVLFGATTKIERGAPFMKLMNRQVQVKPQEPLKDIRGIILSPAGVTNLTGSFEFSFINRGSNDGLRVNDLLYVYSRGHTKRGARVKLPEVNIAALVVVHTSDKNATVYNLGGIDAFDAGFPFKSAIDAEKYLTEGTAKTIAD